MSFWHSTDFICKVTQFFFCTLFYNIYIYCTEYWGCKYVSLDKHWQKSMILRNSCLPWSSSIKKQRYAAARKMLTGEMLFLGGKPAFSPSPSQSVALPGEFSLSHDSQAPPCRDSDSLGLGIWGVGSWNQSPAISHEQAGLRITGFSYGLCQLDHEFFNNRNSCVSFCPDAGNGVV